MPSTRKNSRRESAKRQNNDHRDDSDQVVDISIGTADSHGTKHKRKFAETSRKKPKLNGESSTQNLPTNLDSSVIQSLPKLKYPKNSVLMKKDSINSNDSHKNILCNVVDGICSVEEKNLTNFFSTVISSGSSSSSLQPSETKMAAIRDSLLSILQQLPLAIEDSCDDNVTFLPELNAEERRNRRELIATRNALREQYSALLEFEEIGSDKSAGNATSSSDAIAHTSLNTIYDSLVASESNCSSNSNSNSDSSSANHGSENAIPSSLLALEKELSKEPFAEFRNCSLDESNELHTIASKNDQLLMSLQEHCERLSAVVSDAEKALEIARRSRRDLFDSLQEIKKDSEKSGQVDVPVDVRDVFRRFPGTS